jgi:hypothetical protein
MKRIAILASVLVMAIGSANCSNSGSSLVSPSSVDASAAASDAKGGGKPGGGGTTGGGTISLVMVTDNNGDGLPSFTDVVTFNVSTTATVYPYVTLKCYQNGTLVLKTSNGIFPTSLGQNFQLGPSPAWQSGAADCTANLENWDSYPKTITTLASMSFHAGA